MDLQAVVPCEGLLASAAYVPSLLLFFSNCFADIIKQISGRRNYYKGINLQILLGFMSKLNEWVALIFRNFFFMNLTFAIADSRV